MLGVPVLYQKPDTWLCCLSLEKFVIPGVNTDSKNSELKRYESKSTGTEVRIFYILQPSRVTSTQKVFLEEWAFSLYLKDEQDYMNAMNSGLEDGCGKIQVGPGEWRCEREAQ